MKRLFILIFLSITLCGYGQKIADVFKTMPNDILPGFSEANRTMLLVDTALKVIPYPLGNIEKINYTDSYLQLKIICTIKTVCGDACDSDIRFYSTGWEKIDEKTLLPNVTKEIFFDPAKKGTDAYECALSLLDIEPLSAAFRDGGDDLILTLNYEAYLSKENIAKIKPFIKQDFITLRWTKTAFQL
jgi:hypothetical protein